MKKILHKLLFVALLLSGSAIYSQTALPGTIEVESGNISNSDTANNRPVVGDGNSGTSNVLLNVRKSNGLNAEIINHVSIASDGNYDFTFTYYKTSGSDATVRIYSTDMNGSSGGGTQLASHELVQNSSTATSSAYGTVTISGVALTTSMDYITIRNLDPAIFDLDNIIVTATPVNPTITSSQTGNWNDTATWGGVVPTSTDDVVIADTHNITVGNGVHAQMNNLAVGGNGASIIQSAGSSMTVTGNITLERSQDGYVFAGTAGVDMGTLIYSGLPVTKADGSSSPRVRITQKLPNANQWHLYSYGFKQSRLYEIFLDAHYRVSTTSGNEGNLAFATYDGSAASGSEYSYSYNSATVGSISNSDSNITVDGKGYAINTADGETDVRWRARIQTEDVSIDISDAGDQFNLVGNPYPAYLHANTAADTTNNLLTVNSTVLDEATIWLWDAAGSSFITKNLGDVSFRVNPMQGFFVKAKSGGGTSQSFSFTENMQSHTNTDAFLRSSNNRFEIDLSIANDGLTKNTSIRYIDNTTTSFDNGYDSSMFGGYSTGLAVYTNLVEGDSDIKLAIQSLPNENFESMIVPVGVTAVANAEITFTADAINVPTGYKVFLEDRASNTFTRLDEADAVYIATVSETSTDGRFFLHTTTSVLSAESELLNSVSIYKKDASTLKIVGLSQGNTSVKLYNVLGKQVMSSNFNTTGVKELTLPKLSQGVYIVQLETETGKLNKKIVLE